MDLEHMAIVVDGIDQADVFGELVEQGDATEAKATGACRDIVAEGGRTSEDGAGAIGEFGFVESVEGGALPLGQALVAESLVPLAFGLMFLLVVLHFVLAAEVIVA
jgi:hypothetical protein